MAFITIVLVRHQYKKHVVGQLKSAISTQGKNMMHRYLTLSCCATDTVTDKKLWFSAP
ncbi:hypothetical protein [Veronia pacifica]|uniref:hypothetical protein n=1 Tax=Veronia pacifica TaxID=1080227 RepID=UPI0015863F0D|nr:hypothetical protein [Veronia pacifica]